MGSKKKLSGESKKARRSELVDQVKHPYITGQDFYVDGGWLSKL